jgi:hypothetical protein
MAPPDDLDEWNMDKGMLRSQPMPPEFPRPQYNREQWYQEYRRQRVERSKRRGAQASEQRQQQIAVQATQKTPFRVASPPGSFTIKVRFSFSSSGFDGAAAGLQHLLKGDEVVRRILKVAVLRSVAKNVRARYLANMTKALEMQVLKEQGVERPASQQIKKRMEDVGLQGTIARTMDRLNDAQVSGDLDRAAELRDRLTKLNERMIKQLKKSPEGKTYRSHTFSLKTGNVFRRQMIALLSIITDANFVQDWRVGNLAGVGLGPMNVVDDLTTPSATYMLTGMPTSSRYKSFWRHLEFGTGARRKTAGNPGANKEPTWHYGPRNNENVGLLLRGTQPMNFLFNNNGQFHAEDLLDLDRELTKALDDLLTVR